MVPMVFSELMLMWVSEFVLEVLMRGFLMLDAVVRVEVIVLLFILVMLLLD